MLINNFAKALNNLFLPAIIKIFLLCMLAYAIGWSLFVWLITSVITHYTGIYGAEGFFMNALSTVGGMVIGWFLFPLLYPILISFFDDKMAEVIEENNYPGLPKANPPYWPTILGDILFSLKAIGLNILFLPLYFIPVIGLIVYYLLNGSMLGIQFFRMAAGRRVSQPEAILLQKKAGNSILFIGIAISFFSTIPLLNLAAPVLGVATMLHLFHHLQGNHKQQILPPI